MSIASLAELQSKWEARKTPKEVVDFLIMSGYAPFVRVSKDRGIVVWVKKAYTRSERVYPQERYAVRDGTVKGGVRYVGEVDTTGVHYDERATIEKLAAFYTTQIEDFEPVRQDKHLQQVARNFVMLVENGVVCGDDGCKERTFMRGLGGMLKQ